CEFQDEIMGLAKLFTGLHMFEASIISQVSKLLDVREALNSFKEKRGEYIFLNGKIDSPESYFNMKQWLLDEFEPLLNSLVLNIKKVNSVRNVPFADTEELQKTWNERKKRITELEKIFAGPYFKSSSSIFISKGNKSGTLYGNESKNDSSAVSLTDKTSSPLEGEASSLGGSLKHLGRVIYEKLFCNREGERQKPRTIEDVKKSQEEELRLLKLSVEMLTPENKKKISKLLPVMRKI
ncbi:MAG TPA: hypothetical protein DCL49_02205, partial [Candidatus Omnitrophica bacterium]|nr:hypothetical protein [Candidatus Omnitrophota bacterium]